MSEDELKTDMRNTSNWTHVEIAKYEKGQKEWQVLWSFSKVDENMSIK